MPGAGVGGGKGFLRRRPPVGGGKDAGERIRRPTRHKKAHPHTGRRPAPLHPHAQGGRGSGARDAARPQPGGRSARRREGTAASRGPTAGARVPGARPRARLGLGASQQNQPPAGPGGAGDGDPNPPLFFSPWAACGARELPREEKKPWRALSSTGQKGLGSFSLHRFRLHLGGRRARARALRGNPQPRATPRGAQHPGGGD